MPSDGIIIAGPKAAQVHQGNFEIWAISEANSQGPVRSDWKIPQQKDKIMIPHTPAQRKAKERQRRKDAGEILVSVWVRKEDADAVKSLVWDFLNSRGASDETA